MPKYKKNLSAKLPKPMDFPPEMTNHDKMVWRKDRREREKGIMAEGTNQT